MSVASSPYVTYHVNTFNRLGMLKNLLKSFEICNVYKNFEWVIMDYGSTDGTRDFLFDYMKSNEWLTVLFGNEQKYFEILKSKRLGPKTKRLQAHSIFGLSRNVARQIGRGDIFIDIADDHQFIRKGDWISDCQDIIEHRKNETGILDISSIIYRGLSYERIIKQNNETFPEKVVNNSNSYFVAKHKHYDDYHFMTRSMYDYIGPYFEIDKEKDETRISAWQTGNPDFDHYRDYLERAKIYGVCKVFMKYPYVVDFPNGAYENFVYHDSKLLVSIFDDNEMQKTFANLSRPVSSDEIFRLKGNGW